MPARSRPGSDIVFHVVAGRMGLALGDETYEAAAGESLRFGGNRDISPHMSVDSVAVLVFAPAVSDWTAGPTPVDEHLIYPGSPDSHFSVASNSSDSETGSGLSLSHSFVDGPVLGTGSPVSACTSVESVASNSALMTSAYWYIGAARTRTRS